jgi:hypothetical protein
MSRIIVIPDYAHPRLERCPVLMDEEVRPEHLLDGHAADQLIERVAWAVCDATDTEQQPTIDRRGRAVGRHP